MYFNLKSFKKLIKLYKNLIKNQTKFHEKYQNNKTYKFLKVNLKWVKSIKGNNQRIQH